MTEHTAESWHHVCPECGIAVTVAFEDDCGDRVAVPEPNAGEPCPFCKVEFGPWIEGDAPESEYDEDDEPCFGDENNCPCDDCADMHDDERMK